MTDEIWEYGDNESDIISCDIDYKTQSVTTANITTDLDFDYNQIIRVYDDNNVLGFGGLVTEKIIHEYYKEYNCISFNREVINKKFTETYSSKTAKQIAQDFIDDNCSYIYRSLSIDPDGDFTTTYDIEFKNCSIKEAFDTLADLEDAIWWIDPDGKIWMKKFSSLDQATMYFQAEYNFDKETVGTTGTSIGFVDSVSTAANTSIVASLGGHKKVLKQTNIGGDDWLDHNFTQATAGVHEFWVRPTDATKLTRISFHESGTFCILIRINADIYDYFNGADYTVIAGVTPSDNTWDHLKVQWFADNTFSVWINEVLRVNGVAMYNNQVSGLNRFRYQVYNDTSYLDAYDEAEASGYSAGRNLENVNETTGDVVSIPKLTITSQTYNKVTIYGAINPLTGKPWQTSSGHGEDLESQQQYGIIEYIDYYPQLHTQADVDAMSDALVARTGMVSNPLKIELNIAGLDFIGVGKLMNFSLDKPGFDTYIATNDSYVIVKDNWNAKEDIHSLEISTGIIQGKEQGKSRNVRTMAVDEEQIDNLAEIVQDLSETGLELEDILSSDHTYDGVILKITTAAGVFGKAMYIATANSTNLADADATTTMPCIGIWVASNKVLICGVVRDDSWNWTVGRPIFVSTTTGSLTQTAPTGTGDQVQAVGVAISADIMLVNPSYTLVEVV